MIKPKELTTTLALVAVFLFGYASSTLVVNLSDCDTCSRMAQRTERAMKAVEGMRMREYSGNRTRENNRGTQENRYERNNQRDN